jgi:hypothetical protein
MVELTEEGCQGLLKRVTSGSYTVFVPTTIPQGYRAIISWVEPMASDPKNECFVLLESTDYEKGGMSSTA